MKIKLYGGIGNQLFQFAYLHNYLEKNNSNELSFDFSLVTETENIEAIVKNCPSSTGFYMDISSNLKLKQSLMLAGRILRKVRMVDLNGLVPIPSSFEMHEKNEFTYRKVRVIPLFQSVPIKGFFQHWKYVENVWESISKEIFAHLDAIEIEDHLVKILKDGCIVVHVRGGDYLDPKMQRIFGKLSWEYYDSAIKTVLSLTGNQFPIVVISNDLGLARETFRNNSSDSMMFLDTKSQNAWQALKIMSLAKIVVTANSTFSWWGGYICHKMGGRAITPSPWFNNLSEDSEDGLHFPGFLRIESRYS